MRSAANGGQPIFLTCEAATIGVPGRREGKKVTGGEQLIAGNVDRFETTTNQTGISERSIK